jgi:aryl-alcohol dehydrogenase-like predicted oxidoreductase
MQRDRSVLELAIAWLLAHPAVSCVIAGAMNLSQLEENAAAVGWKPTRDEKERIDEITASDATTELAEPTPAVLLAR